MTRTPRQRLRLALIKTFARLTPVAPRPTRRAPRILVIRPDHLGDLLFATPALRELRQRLPDAHITALVGPWGAPVLAHNPNVDEILTLPFPGFMRQAKQSPWQPYTLLWRWARQLRNRFDLALILRFDHWWGAWLAHLAGIPAREGYAIPEVRPFLSRALPYVSGRHEVAQNLKFVEPMIDNWEWASQVLRNGDLSSHLPSFYPLEFHVPDQAAVWARNLLQNRAAIAIHPGAGAAVKLWRVEGWAQVADALAQRSRDPIILTGSDSERDLCQAIAEKMSAPAWVVAGETTLDQLAALFARCRLVLGVDSGPMHLAVAVGTPTVHLYGPVDAAKFGPWGPAAHHRVLTSAWPCIPCDRLDYADAELVDHPCVREIDAEAVLNAAQQVLENSVGK